MSRSKNGSKNGTLLDIGVCWDLVVEMRSLDHPILPAVFPEMGHPMTEEL
jgi:hypothetical protein